MTRNKNNPEPPYPNAADALVALAVFTIIFALANIQHFI